MAPEINKEQIAQITLQRFLYGIPKEDKAPRDGACSVLCLMTDGSVYVVRKDLNEDAAAALAKQGNAILQRFEERRELVLLITPMQWTPSMQPIIVASPAGDASEAAYAALSETPGDIAARRLDTADFIDHMERILPSRMREPMSPAAFSRALDTGRPANNGRHQARQYTQREVEISKQASQARVDSSTKKAALKAMKKAEAHMRTMHGNYEAAVSPVDKEKWSGKALTAVGLYEEAKATYDKVCEIAPELA